MNIKQKLITGFIVVAFLVMIAGGVGIFISISISQNSDVIIKEEFPLKDISMEAIISLREGANAASQYVYRTDGLEDLERAMRTSIEDFNMWVAMIRYGTESSEFTNSEFQRLYQNAGIDIVVPKKGSPEVIEHIDTADDYHEQFEENSEMLVKNREEQLKYNFTYADKSWNFEEFLYLIELQHKEWIEELSDAVTAGTSFTGQTDPTQCFFGQWFYNYSIDDPELNALLAQLEPFHNELHQSAIAINNTDDREEKISLYDNSIRSVKANINSMFTQIREYIVPHIESIEREQNRDVAGMLQAVNKAGESLEAMESQIDQEIDSVLSQAQRGQRLGIFILIGVSIVSVVIALAIGIPIAVNISRPLQAVTAQFNQIALGNLDTEEIAVKTKDEIAELNRAFIRMVDEFRKKASVVEQIANGDLTVDIEPASEEDGLGNSLVQMRNSLHELIAQISEAISQIASGADQIANASQNLSQGATEQASSLEEITSSINEINSQSAENVKNAEEANSQSKQASVSAGNGMDQMKQLTEAMRGITSSSEEINNIVKTIDDISFQINLLALNANVEAARVGKYGKGFAVVAEEVRNLANRSGESVQETSQKVEEANKNIRLGSELVEKTANQLEEIVQQSNNIAAFLEEITQAGREQAQGIEQIAEGLDQIDQVTQSNTASAEQSASSAEELSSQAQQLKGMIARFTLNSEKTAIALLE